MEVQLARRLFTVAEYHKMAEAGILSEDDRVELLEGEIVAMSPIGSRHAACVMRLTELLSERVVGRAHVNVQNPVRLGEHSEPQPDLALLRRRRDFYASSHPGPEDVLLVIEVAETSAAVDREVKVPLYARFGVPEVWLVDLAGDQVEVFREPSAEGYREVRVLRRGESLAPALLPDLLVPVDAVLG
jgi:Uma2 family endonuclease